MSAAAVHLVAFLVVVLSAPAVVVLLGLAVLAQADPGRHAQPQTSTGRHSAHSAHSARRSQ